MAENLAWISRGGPRSSSAQEIDSDPPQLFRQYVDILKIIYSFFFLCIFLNLTNFQSSFLLMEIKKICKGLAI